MPIIIQLQWNLHRYKSWAVWFFYKLSPTWAHHVLGVIISWIWWIRYYYMQNTEYGVIILWPVKVHKWLQLSGGILVAFFISKVSDKDAVKGKYQKSLFNEINLILTVLFIVHMHYTLNMKSILLKFWRIGHLSANLFVVIMSRCSENCSRQQQSNSHLHSFRKYVSFVYNGGIKTPFHDSAI